MYEYNVRKILQRLFASAACCTIFKGISHLLAICRYVAFTFTINVPPEKALLW